MIAAPNTFLEFASAVIIIGGAFTAVYKGYVWTSERSRTASAHWAMMTEGMPRLLAKVDVIETEVKYNGGSSMKDVIRGVRNDIAMERAARRQGMYSAMYELRWQPGYAVNGERQLKCVHVTQSFTDLTGLTRDDCDGEGWTAAVAAGERQEILDEILTARRLGLVFRATYTLTHMQTRARVSVEHISTPVFDQDRNIVGWIGEIADTAGSRKYLTAQQITTDIATAVHEHEARDHSHTTPESR